MEPGADPSEERLRGRSNYSVWDGVVLGLVGAGLLVLWPVILPVALVLNSKAERRKRECARNFRCAACGQGLGDTSVDLADAECSAYMDELKRQSPGVRFRVVRTLDAICATCGKRYTYLEKEYTFVAEPDEAQAMRQARLARSA